MKEINEKIRKIIDESLSEELFKSSYELKDDENLFNVGLDSLNIVKLIIGVENEFDIVFEDSEIAGENWKDINTILNLILAKK